MKKKRKTLLNLLFSAEGLHLLYIVISILVQLGAMTAAVLILQQHFFVFYAVTSLVSFIIALHIINNRSNPAYKITWLTLILFLPLFGILMYLLFGLGYLENKTRVRLQKAEGQSNACLCKEQEEEIQDLVPEDIGIQRQMLYLCHKANCPVYTNTRTEYLSPGEVAFARIKDEIAKAKRFIFIEFFIIAAGEVWEEMLFLLKGKAAEGVEVRIIYDALGSAITLPKDYENQLAEAGIQCRKFNKLVPILGAIINHRDHRKIVVIDGRIGLTGGINIADEYANIYAKHGYWKDSAILLEGEAVWSLTVMFLSTWSFVTGDDDDFQLYQHTDSFNFEESGIVQPYYDSPLDGELIGETVYMNMITRAKRYVYIQSPYLVVDNEMIVALCNAAKQGIDVKISVPHIPDHWYVHLMTQSNYETLTKCGVKIYEYTPGFLHSKIIICDDELATIGTFNMDYRSLYLHFECGVLLYKAPVIQDMLVDFHGILAASQEVTYADAVDVPWYKKLGRALLKIFAPLM